MHLASRGQRDLDEGREAIVDPIELERVRRQARTVQIKTLMFTIAGTALALVVPELLR